MIEKLHWLGHASFRLDGQKTVYFDPWKLPKGSKYADIILISHEHFDHFSKDDVARISSKDTVIITSETVARQLKGSKVPYKDIKAMAPGDAFEALGVIVKAVTSYNVNKSFHTRDSKKLGFIISIDGSSLYHAGDTDKIPEMKEHRCDIAILPVSGTYVMTSEEASQAALAIKPKIAVPMHYGDIVGSIEDAKNFKDLLKGKVEVRILEKES